MTSTDLARLNYSVAGRGNRDDIVPAADVRDLLASGLASLYDPETDPLVVVSGPVPAGDEMEVAAQRAQADDDADMGKGYDGMTVPELREEIDRRNEHRVEPLPTTGKKADLIAGLVKDDQPDA